MAAFDSYVDPVAEFPVTETPPLQLCVKQPNLDSSHARPAEFGNGVYNVDNQSTNASFLYDNGGNPTTYFDTTLPFDPENRLTAYGNALTAGYTAENLRAWKQTGGDRTYFLYDGMTPLLEMNAAGTITAANTLVDSGMLARHTGTTSVFYTFDPQGNVAQRLDTSGNVLSTSLFDAFGVGISNPATSDPYGYGGKWGYYTDAETGLQLLGHRYYDPGAGRFLTRDPIGYEGGMNLYSYTANNPVMDADPSGESCDPVVYNCARGWFHQNIIHHAFFWIHFPCNPGDDYSVSYGPIGGYQGNPPTGQPGHAGEPDDMRSIHEGAVRCNRTTCKKEDIDAEGSEIRKGGKWDPGDYYSKEDPGCWDFNDKAHSKHNCTDVGRTFHPTPMPPGRH